MERGARGHGGPQPATLPAAFRIVDSSVHPLRIEAEWIRHPQHDPFAILQRQQRLGCVAGTDWCVRAEAERVELIDPRIVAALRASAIGDALHLRERLGVEGPTLVTVLTGRF